ncbi:PCDA4-like protein [Mya arenaria]|uniref:PCDA4-like protein n=1 Tax=Mya arenaria TaxID=6604 RepID=A0ABY7DRR7_MYAAR|nr:PCDA4-like protein [Mya arenaria]
MATIVAVTILLASTLVAMTRGQGTMLTFRINEEEPAGTFVGSVADANLEGTSFRYTIIGTQTDFSLQDQTGNLYTMTKIDRDSKCKDAQSSTNGECVIELLVGAESGTFYATVTVKVVINDVNDNAPLFPSYTHELRIVEGTPRLTEFSIPRAVDTDYGSNGITKYEISPSHPSFGIRATKNLAGKFDVFIVVLDTIDRETEDTYQLEVFAIDGGGRRGGMTVNVIVTDINDNEPVFDRSNYTTTVEEGTARGTVILTIQATDKDIGDNGKVSYKIADGFTLTDFVLNSTSGEIYVDTDDLVYYPVTGVISAKPFFDRESTPVIVFEVLAIDSGAKPLTGTATVTLTIEDVNDNAPKFRQPSYSLEVLENLPSGTYVDQISATDLDIGVNGMFTFSLSSEYLESRLPFIVFENGEIQTNKALDRETRSSYMFDVVVQDQGSPPLDNSVKVTVIVKDVEVNDKGDPVLKSHADLVVSVIYSNATYQDLSGEKDQLVVIVVVVVVVTAVFSAIIIGVIVLLRNWDRKKSLPDSTDKPETTEQGYSSVDKPSLFILNNAGESSTDYPSPYAEVTRKKKEVSFSLDEMDSGFQNMQLHVNLSPEPSKYAPEKPPRQESPDSTKDLYDKVTTRLETLRLQQMLMGTRARQHHPAPHPDDSRSESSGETSSGDSGRGANDQKVFDYIVPSSSFSTSSQSHRPSPSKADSRSVAPPPIPHRTYRPYSSFNRNQTYTGNQDYSSDYGSNYQYLNDSNKPYRHSDIIDPSALSWQHAQPRSYSTKLNSVNIQSDFSFSPSQYRLHPRDDDDCSTTTSGSYTLHSIEDLL